MSFVLPGGVTVDDFGRMRAPRKTKSNPVTYFVRVQNYRTGVTRTIERTGTLKEVRDWLFFYIFDQGTSVQLGGEIWRTYTNQSKRVATQNRGVVHVVPQEG